MPTDNYKLQVTPISRSEEYKQYCEMARKRGLNPGTFRDFVKAMNEYDDEWEIANYEWEHADDDH